MVCSRIDGAVSEIDEVRFSDPDLKVTSHQMRMYLKQAKLEQLGFNKTTEKAIETDEKGQRRIKETVRYMVRDQCSTAQTWQEKLQKRLPDKFFTSNLSTTFAREIESRTLGRSTKYCEMGLEVHFNGPWQASRGARKRRWLVRISGRVRIRICSKAKIMY